LDKRSHPRQRSARTATILSCLFVERGIANQDRYGTRSMRSSYGVYVAKIRQRKTEAGTTGAGYRTLLTEDDGILFTEIANRFRYYRYCPSSVSWIRNDFCLVCCLLVADHLMMDPHKRLLKTNTAIRCQYCTRRALAFCFVRFSTRRKEGGSKIATKDSRKPTTGVAR